MAATGPDKASAGSQALAKAIERDDPRPLWICLWGGVNTLAQALMDLRAAHSASEMDRLIARLRVSSISDQDDADPWIRRELPTLFYVAKPSPPNREEYYEATWTGISGDMYYRNGAGAAQDRVIGIDGIEHVSDQATIWRWREAYQNDFAARMDWTIKDFAHANHNPEVVLNGQLCTGTLELTADAEQIITLDGAGSKDPDGQKLHYKWWIYEEAGLAGTHGAHVTIQGGDSSQAQVTINSPCRANWLPLMPCRGGGVVHIILEVTDEGTPKLCDTEPENHPNTLERARPDQKMRLSTAAIMLLSALTGKVPRNLRVSGPIVRGVLRVRTERPSAAWKCGSLGHDRLWCVVLLNPSLKSGERVKLVGGRPSATMIHAGNEEETGE
jgi:hypothetical protein